MFCAAPKFKLFDPKLFKLRDDGLLKRPPDCTVLVPIADVVPMPKPKPPEGGAAGAAALDPPKLKDDVGTDDDVPPKLNPDIAGAVELFAPPPKLNADVLCEDAGLLPKLKPVEAGVVDSVEAELALLPKLKPDEAGVDDVCGAPKEKLDDAAGAVLGALKLKVDAEGLEPKPRLGVDADEAAGLAAGVLVALKFGVEEEPKPKLGVALALPPQKENAILCKIRRTRTNSIILFMK
jgi:hypothetical protein